MLGVLGQEAAGRMHGGFAVEGVSSLLGTGTAGMAASPAPGSRSIGPGWEGVVAMSSAGCRVEGDEIGQCSSLSTAHRSYATSVPSCYPRW